MQPNIVWITLDSIRADHTSMGGYKRDTTPNIDRIGREGQSFDHCISSGTGTPYSSASILTGTYPSRHGVKITNEYLPEQLATLPELLGDAGYHTACLSRNSYVSPGTGLDRGFDRFEWISGSTILDAVPLRTLVKYFFNLRRHSAGLALDTAKYATPYVMNDTVKRWLRDLQQQDPFFLYLHYNEPHRPYYPPLPYVDRYTDEIEMSPQEAAEFSIDVHRNLDEYIADGLDFSDDEWDALYAMYDAEIRYTDEMIGQLFDYIQSLDLEDTIFIITADHGELFGERGLLSHKVVVDDALTHVPLVTHGFEDIAHQTDELLQHVDLTTTLVEMFGEPTPQLQGIDLREQTREHAFVQRGPFDFELFKQFNSDFDDSIFHHGLVHGVRTKQHRFEMSGGMKRLYALPDETTDVRSSYPEIADELETTLDGWVEENGSHIETDAESKLDDAMRQQLRDLGYVE